MSDLTKMKNDFKNHPAYLYAQSVANDEIPTNKYIHIVCQTFLDDIDNNSDDFRFIFDYKMFKKVNAILSLVVTPNGMSAGKPVNEILVGFQWFFIVNIMCWKHKDDPAKRRYQKAVLLIARKSGKTFLSGLIFILLMLLEQRFAKMFTVAPTKDLASQMYEQIVAILKSSPALMKHFKITNDWIVCKMNDTKFTPLANGKDKLDGREANAFVADEVGALKNFAPISAMQSSQGNLKNKTGILISTAYESLNNPMSVEVELAEKILEGKFDEVENDEENNGENPYDEQFSMLFKPDHPDEWKDNDDELLKANPLAVEYDGVFKSLKKARKEAIDTDEKRGNFLTKHMNIFINGGLVDTFLQEEDLQGLSVDKDSLNWNGKEVYVGVDLSRSDDNTAVSMVNYDFSTQQFYSKTWVFFPSKRLDDKTKDEGLNYQKAVDEGLAIPSGDMTIDYNQIENFILGLENLYGVKILGIGYDTWSAKSMSVRLSEYYPVFEVVQGFKSYNATKLLYESVLNKQFIYEDNFLFDSNLLSAKKIISTTYAYYLNKKTSKGKIDAVAALIDAIELWRVAIDNGGMNQWEIFAF